jgi:formylglycine-generating enzyme required for sulfatase activity
MSRSALGAFLVALLTLASLLPTQAAVTGVTLSSTPPSPVRVGTPVTLRAVATPAGAVAYKFRVGIKSGASYGWTTLREYSTTATCLWTPATSATYSLVVYARTVGSTAAYEVFKSIALTVKEPLAGVSLSASPRAPQAVGTPVTLTASPGGGGQVEYKFRVGLKSGGVYQWTDLRPYQPDRVCVWTPAAPGAYTLAVYAREVGSTKSYDVYTTMAYAIYSVPPTAVALSAAPSPTWVGHETTLRATPTGGTQVHYRFRVARKIGTVLTWTTVQEMSASATCAWTPTVAATYTVAVYAKEVGSPKSYDCYRAISLSVTATPPAPTLTDFTPMSGPVGTTVTLTGTGFTGATVVTFNGVSATFAVEDDSILTATVPSGATTGPIAITTAGGTATSATEFTVTGFTPPNGHEMVWVPGGSFTMGTEYGEVWWDAPHTQQVTLSGYWLDKYEVTVAQYRAFCAATSRALPSFPSGYCWADKSGWDDPTLQMHPIVNVTWYDAKAYADWAGLQLPTEAQWEYAARGPEGRNYPWGGTATSDNPYHGWDASKCANVYNSSNVGTSTWPVGSFPSGVSWCGVQDLAGNVWEWCADWYAPYANTPVTNPQGPSSGTVRMLRGGSWDNDEYGTRGAYRYGGGSPDIWYNNVGFRCASLSPAPNAPTLTDFTPMSAPVGTLVTLTGTHFTGTTAVTFNDTAALFTVVNDTTITTTVPAGATTGKISVTTPGGTATSITAFTVTGFTPPNGHQMVWVPGGSFTMGTEYGAWWSPMTQQVTLDGFWLDKYEVTVAQYRAFCAETGRALPHFPQPVTDWGASTNYSWAGKSGWDDPSLQQHPIVNVSWHDAKAYADWAGLQLPTEAQWEYAARGSAGYNFPWGGTASFGNLYDGWDPTKCANHNNSSNVGKSTWPVGSFPSGASWCGAQDLAGNVWEWCADWYGPYSSTPVTNPQGPSSGTDRVMRGGSWESYDGDFAHYYLGSVSRGARRSYLNPDNLYYLLLFNTGFRCASLSPGP